MMHARQFPRRELDLYWLVVATCRVWRGVVAMAGCARRLVVGVCRSTISLLLGAALAAVFGLGVVAGIGGAVVGSAPDAAVTRFFSNIHGVKLASVLHRLIEDAEPAAAPDRSRVARGARGMQPDKFSLLSEDRATTNTAGRLVAFVVSAAGFYGAYRSGGGLESWWNGKGKFPLSPKGKAALRFTGGALLALVVGLAGVGLIVSAAGILTGNDTAVLAGRGTPDPFTRALPTVESARSDALTSFCIGLALIGGAALFMGWVFYKIVKGLRSLFRPAQSTGAGQ
jgi:hypothetical protein